MNLYDILKSAHSGWRYLVLILLIVAVIQALAGWFGKKAYTEGNRKLNVFTLISAHIQFLLGIGLYVLSPLTKGPTGEALYRYWKMEHIAIMIVAIVLITIGNARSKKMADAARAAVQSPEVKRRIENEGATPVGNSPEEFARFVDSEIVRWRKVVQYAGAKPE